MQTTHKQIEPTDTRSSADEFVKVREILEAGLDQPGVPINILDIQHGLAKGAYQLWVGERSAMITMILDHDQGARTIQAFLAGGDMKELLGMAVDIEEWGREHGCTRAEVSSGREGWGQTLLKHGFEKLCTVFWKDLT